MAIKLDEPQKLYCDYEENESKHVGLQIRQIFNVIGAWRLKGILLKFLYVLARPILFEKEEHQGAYGASDLQKFQPVPYLFEVWAFFATKFSDLSKEEDDENNHEQKLTNLECWTELGRSVEGKGLYRHRDIRSTGWGSFK